MSSKEVLIAIPVYNEGKKIYEIVCNVQNSISGSPADILIIDDGSTDTTPLNLKKIKDITIISHMQNEGYGRSLIDAFDHAIRNNYKYVITMDCDFQHEPEKIREFNKK